MVYQIKYKNKGFSIIELLLVIAIFSILVAISNSAYVNFKASSNLKIATTNFVQAVRYAQSNSEVNKNDSKWGVKLLSNQIVIFKGNNYVNREVVFDQLLDLPKGVSPNGIDEFVFEKMTGSTTEGITILTNNSGVKNILINEKGTITY